VGTLGSAKIVVSCAACGRRTATPGHWARRRDLLLCPDCDAVLAARSDKVGVHLAAAEREWESQWREVDEALDESA
jgi:hypothetical protein